MNYLGAYGDDDDDDEASRLEERRRRQVAQKLSSYTAPKDLLIPREEDEEDFEEDFSDQLGKSRRIVDRESEYQKRRLNRTLSPPRVDPFALAQSGKAPPSHLRTYGDAVKDANLERERFYTLKNIEEKQKREREEESKPEPQARSRDNFSGRGREREREEREESGAGGSERRHRHRSRSPPRGRYDGEREERSGRGRGRGVGRDFDTRRHGADGGNSPPREEEDQEDEKKAPAANFGLSGKLAEETNTVRGVNLVYNEPPDKCPPSQNWRLYVFKKGKALEKEEGGVLHIAKQSMYLIGRERKVADIPTDHPSCSKQHACIQYRKVSDSNGGKPYLIDLGSTNGSFINTERIEPQRYYQLLEGDTIKFGSSSREYVLLHDKSK